LQQVAKEGMPEGMLPEMQALQDEVQAALAQSVEAGTESKGAAADVEVGTRLHEAGSSAEYVATEELSEADAGVVEAPAVGPIAAQEAEQHEHGAEAQTAADEAASSEQNKESNDESAYQQ
jgi:hypothetical protein